MSSDVSVSIDRFNKVQSKMQDGSYSAQKDSLHWWQVAGDLSSRSLGRAPMKASRLGLLQCSEAHRCILLI